ncbi:unnamed protein product [Paramecium sonneborni]|uniref:Uncharacterized protein n=1 Tax=Paramecium sonneborni TaxID=65129 RepID=A0A8S1NY93_9CILI|nr:unnamed protein product [Paramecium sonneborni]
MEIRNKEVVIYIRVTCSTFQEVINIHVFLDLKIDKYNQEYQQLFLYQNYFKKRVNYYQQLGDIMYNHFKIYTNYHYHLRTQKQIYKYSLKKDSKCIFQEKSFFDDSVRSICISQDNHTLLCCSKKLFIKQYDVRMIQQLKTHNHYMITLGPDEKYFLQLLTFNQLMLIDFIITNQKQKMKMQFQVFSFIQYLDKCFLQILDEIQLF